MIDEPNSFLHPSALRRLLVFCRRFKNHQIIVSTHTPDVISISQPEKLLLLQWDEERGESCVISKSGDELEHVRNAISEIGANLTDVFGYDVVCFVEGPTESECFPLFFPERRAGINFVPMREASAFTRRKARQLFDIYNSGVSGSALFPPKAAFSFDREGKGEEEIREVERISGGAAQFLPRPMYENYLLNENAILFLLGKLGENTAALRPHEIGIWIDENWQHYKVDDNTSSPENCNAAKLLNALFIKFTEARYEYRKIEHGRMLTSWILENDPDHFAELKNYIEQLLNIGQS